MSNRQHDVNSKQNPPRVLVIGGGISGLACCYRLLERSKAETFPLELLLVESKGRLGGVIGTFTEEGFLLEAASDSFITDKPWALNLCRRLGLQDQLIETNLECRQSFVVRNDRLVAVPAGFYLLAPSRLQPFLTSPFLSPIGKIRLLSECIIPKKEGLQDESVASFVRRRFGREAFDRIAQPMISGIYASDPENLSMRATLPRFLEMEEEYGSIIRAIRSGGRVADEKKGTSGPRYGLFLSFRKGMQTLIDRLGACLPPEAVHLNRSVHRIQPYSEDSGWTILLEDGAHLQVDALCLALPAYQAGRLLREVDGTLSDQLEEIPYTSSATLHLAYLRTDIRHPLNGFGFVVPAVERYPFLGCSFTSVKFPGRSPEGKVLLRVFLAGGQRFPLEYLSDEEIRSQVLERLKPLLGITAPPLFTKLIHSPNSMPQYQVEHLARVNKVEDALRAYPGLALSGNAYRGIGIPDCVHSGEQAADTLFDQLKKSFSTEEILHVPAEAD